MDSPLLAPHDLIRPWRRATIAAGTIAAAELVLLLIAGALLLAKPVSHMIERQAVAAATTTPPSKQLAKAIKQISAPPGKARPRAHLSIMVFNGNGLAGAAGHAASRLHALGYKIAGKANAKRQDYASSIVMYKPGFRSEGIRLARDLHVKVVGPLDGLTTGALHGGQLVVIVGA